MKTIAGIFAGLLLGLSSLSAAALDLNGSGTGLPMLKCTPNMTEDECAMADQINKKNLASTEATTMPAGLEFESLQIDKQDTSCTTDAYACFSMANNDNKLEGDERQTSYLWLWWLCCR